MPTRLLLRAALVVIVVLVPWLAAQDPLSPAVVTSFKGHSKLVYAVAFTPDSKQVVTASFDKTLKAWDAVTGKLLKTFGGPQGHTGMVLSLALSTDGSMLASGSSDNTARIWDYPTSNPLRQFVGSDSFTAVAVTTDDTKVAGASKDGLIRLWNNVDGKELFKLESHAGPVVGLGFSPNGQTLVSAGSDRTIRIWNVADGKSGAVLGAHSKALTGMVVSPGGNAVVSSDEAGVVKFWTLPAVASRPLAAAHPDSVTAVTLSADQNTIATACADKQVRLWTFANGQLLRTLTGPKSAVKSVAYAPNNAIVVGGTAENTLWIWNAADGKVLLETMAHNGAVNTVAVAGSNAQVLSGGSDGLLKTWALPVMPPPVMPQKSWEAHPGGVTSVVYHSNGTQALSGGNDKKVVLWDLATSKPVRPFGPLADPVSAVALSRDSVLAAAAGGKTVKIWNLADGKDVQTLTHPADVLSLSFNGDKTRLVTGAADNVARVWDVTTGQELQFFTHSGPVSGVVFHNNNQNIVTGSADKTVAVQTMALSRFLVVGSPVRAVAMTPNGSHVLTGSDDKAVKIWNAGTGALERTIAGAEGPVRAVAVSKNNVLLAAGGADGLRIYQFADGKPMSSAPTPGAVQALSFSPNNLSVAAACVNNSAQIFSTAFNAGQPLPPEFGRGGQSFTLSGPAADVAFGPDNATLYAAGADKAILVYRAAAENPVKTFGHPAPVDAVAFNKDGTILATAAHDGKVRFFDVAKAALLKETAAPMTGMPPTPISAYCLAWSPDSKTVVSGGSDNIARLWDATSGAMVREFKKPAAQDSDKGQRDGIFSVAISPDGKTLATGSSNRGIRLWNIADGTMIKELANPNVKASQGQPVAAHPGWVYGVRFTQDGKFLVSAGPAPRNHGYLALWNVADGSLVAGEELPLGTFYGLALSADGKMAAIGSNNQVGYLLHVPGIK